MAELARWKLDGGGEVLIEVASDGPELSPVSRNSGGAAETAGATLAAALHPIRDAASTVLGQFRAMAARPDKIEVEFGVKLNAQVGAVIAKTAVEGHLNVKLTWEADNPPEAAAP